jgi:DNA polymerase III subunit epsilon
VILELDVPIVFLDTETTGVHKNVDKVVQIGAVKYYPGKPPVEWETLVNPGILIPPEATAVHGITDEMVRDAPRFEQVADKLANSVLKCDLGGWNVGFDIDMLEEEYKRLGKPSPFSACRVVDGFDLERRVNPRDLSTAYEKYTGKPMVNAHSALADARASAEATLGLLERFADLPRRVHEIDALRNEVRDGQVDSEGKLSWRHGEACINFGKNAGVLLRNCDRGYLDWIIKSDFSEEFKAIVRDAQRGRYPTKK